MWRTGDGVARAARGGGVGAGFMETRPGPDSAPSDGPNMGAMAEMEALLGRLMDFDRLAKA